MTQNYLPKDAADYPKTSAARTFMVETALKAAEGYAEQMKKLSKEDRLQKKALAIQKHMAEHCEPLPPWDTIRAPGRIRLPDGRPS